jgi:hypothetical protein
MTVQRFLDSEVRRASIFCFAVLVALSAVSLGCSSQSGDPPVVAAELSHAVDSTLPPNELPRVQIISVPDKSTVNSAVRHIDFGIVHQGECLRRTLIIENRTPKPMTIDRFDASCECLKPTGLPLTIAAGSEARLDVLFDERQELEFHGNLGIDFTAFYGSRRAFGIVVDVAVVSSTAMKRGNESISEPANRGARNGRPLLRQLL